MRQLAQTIFERLAEVRYVATYVDGELQLNSRPGIGNASSSESDKYEELIVNPTLIKLLTQRGNIDCGGLQYVIIRYGSFFQFIEAVAGGHVSVALETDADVLECVERIRQIIVARS